MVIDTLIQKRKWVIAMILIIVVILIGGIISNANRTTDPYELVNKDLEVPEEIEDMFLMTENELEELYETDIDYNDEEDMLRKAAAHYWVEHLVYLDPLDSEEYRGRNEHARLEIYEYLKTDNYIVNRLNDDVKVITDTDFDDDDWQSEELPNENDHWTSVHDALGTLNFGIYSQPYRTGNLYQNDKIVELGNLTIDFVTIDIRENQFVINMLLRTNDNTFKTFKAINDTGLFVEINDIVYGDALNTDNGDFQSQGSAKYVSGLPISVTLTNYFSEEEATSRAGSYGIYNSILPQYYIIEYPVPDSEQNFDVLEALNFDENLFRDLEADALSVYDIFWGEPDYKWTYDDDDDEMTQLRDSYREQLPSELNITFHYGDVEADYTLIRGKEIDFTEFVLRGIAD